MTFNNSTGLSSAALRMISGPSCRQDYALLKAAETAVANGGTHFIILTVEDATRTSVGITPTTVNTAGQATYSQFGNIGYGNYNSSSYVTGGVPYDIVKPGQNMVIQVIRITGAAPAYAWSAAEIISIIGSRVLRPQ